MTTIIDSGVTLTSGRPRYEGANIRTWVGFKHFMYLVEEGVLTWFRERGLSAGHLYHECGYGLEIVDSSVQLPAVLDVDDDVDIEVTRVRDGRFTLRLSVNRDGTDVGVCKAKVGVALVRETDAPGCAALPEEVAACAVDAAASVAGNEARRHDLDLPAGIDAAAFLAPAGSGVFVWPWTARYFVCHYSDRVQHSAYVRALEEVVDRFLADRGISVGRMLTERGWIPVVSRARIHLLADAHMEETVYTTFTVTDVLKAISYEARMDCYVQRGQTLVHVATANILHGYAASRGEGAGSLATFDDETIDALTGGRC